MTKTHRIAPPFMFKIVRLNPDKVKLYVKLRTGELFASNTFPTIAQAEQGFITGDYHPIEIPF